MLANFKFEKENTGIKANKTLEQPNLKNVQNPETTIIFHLKHCDLQFILRRKEIASDNIPNHIETWPGFW